MNKKSMSIATLGMISTVFLGCSNEIQAPATQQIQPQQVSAQSNQGLSNFVKSFSETYFKVLDKDKDGFLTLEEYSSYSPGDASKLAFKKMDKDNDGKISIDDVRVSPKIFLSVFPSLQNKEQIRTYIQSRMTSYDINKDTFVNEEEFINAAMKEFSFFLNTNNSMTQVALTSYMFESADKNHDKKLTFSEFEDFYYNMTKGIMKACTLASGTSTAPSEPVPADPYNTPGYNYNP